MTELWVLTQLKKDMFIRGTEELQLLRGRRKGITAP